MKISIVSDLHLESYSNTEIMKLLLGFSEGDLLILAGDICEMNNLSRFEGVFRTLSHIYDTIVYIPGNHEYYHSTFNLRKLRDFSEIYDIRVLNNESLLVDKWRVIGATLWTDLKDKNPLVEWMSAKVMNDYRLIRLPRESRPIHPSTTYYEHMNSLSFIKEEVNKANRIGEPCIVVTHHAPSIRSISPIYWEQGDPAINYNFFSPILDRGDVSFDNDAIWIHGHTHESFDYMIENVRVICNPLGYSTQNKLDNYQPLNLEL